MNKFKTTPYTLLHHPVASINQALSTYPSTTDSQNAPTRPHPPNAFLLGSRCPNPIAISSYAYTYGAPTSRRRPETS
ncbi:hypothetical protein BJX62DRAFT_214273 [Aspergillus germanicus]